MPQEKVFIGAPAVCPVCQSQSLSTSSNSKKDPSPYWRCENCGEVWNPERLRDAQLAGRRLR